MLLGVILVRNNSKARREERKKASTERQERRSLRSVLEQIALLDKRPGKAEAERSRLRENL